MWYHRRLSIMKTMLLLWSTSVEKRIVALSLLSFSLIFFFLLFLGLLFYFFLFGIFSLFLFTHTGQWSNNEDHHTFIYLQLKNYNSILEQIYDSIWVPPAVYRDVQWLKSDMYEKWWTVALPQIRCQLHDRAKQYDNDEVCHNNRTVENCMAIYLGMAMEMP